MSQNNTDNLAHTDNEHQQQYNKLGFSSWDLLNIVDKNAISTIVCLLGVVSNIINLLVFLRQGFSDAVNVSLLGLAVSDTGLLISLLAMHLCTNPLIYTFTSIPYYPSELAVFPGTLYISFSKLSCLITNFVTIQRCLCMSYPLKIKLLMTPQRTALVLASMSLAVFFIVTFPATCTGSAYIGWKTLPLFNKSILGLIINDKFGIINNISMYILTSVQITLFITIISSTAILIYQLKRQAQWRNSSKALSFDKSQQFSQRDYKLSRMIVVLSIVLILGITPSTGSLIFNFCVPAVSNVSSIDHVYSLFWTLGALCEALNSSASLCVYYNVSSKYRKTFVSIMCVSKK
ncbi:hypothetical protein BsWGS_27599 [Bradybaena similaris]